MKLYLKITLLLTLMTGVLLHGQITAPGADTSVVALYSLQKEANRIDVDYAVDEAIYIYGDSILFDATDELLPFRTDSLYSADSAVYARDNVRSCTIINLQKTYCYLSWDTAYFYFDTLSQYTDSVFLFNVPQGSTNDSLGLLNAKHPTLSSDITFNWEVYDTAAKQFVSSSLVGPTINNLPSGGYRVQIEHTTGDQDTSFTAWVHTNNPYLEIEKDRTVQKCNLTEFYHKGQIDSFYYYDTNGISYLVGNKWSYDWTSNPESNITDPRFNITRISNPPAEDTDYFLTGTDAYNAKRRDTIFIVAIASEAKFTIKVQDQKMRTKIPPDGFEDHPVSAGEGYSGPLQVVFIDSSTNAASFEWFFGDDNNTAQYNRVVETDELTYDTSYIYYRPGNYNPILRVVSSQFCESFDSLNPTDILSISEGVLEIPNTFNPTLSTAQQGSIFKVASTSIHYIEVYIYNKWGQEVYQYTGSLEQWEGWNGNKNGDGKECPMGHYYYVIKASDYSDPARRFEGKDYSGHVYLFR